MRKRLKQLFFIFRKFVSAILYPLYVLRGSLGKSIPVLMYHRVCDMPTESTDVRYDNVFPEQFEKQMQYLYKNKYHVVNLSDYLKWLKGEVDLPKKSVVITFDDGYKVVYDNAFPILRKYGFSAAVFLVTDYVGKSEVFAWLKWDSNALADREKNIANWLPLSGDEIRQMENHNISIGSHPQSHPHLGKLNLQEIKRELQDSKKAIEKEIGKEVEYFSYPVGIRQYGAFNDITKKELIASGYKMAFTSEIGRNKRGSDLYTQRRIAVSEGDSLFDFKCKLVGAYDWVGVFQKIFQKMFREGD